MNKVSAVRDDHLNRTGWRFFCPGCRESHVIWTQNPGGPVWGFNNDTARPTFTPSLLITTGCQTARHRPGDNCWCSYNAEEVAKGNQPAPFKCGRCHLFLTDGKLQFLGDCTHDMANQTVDLPDLPEG